MTVITNLSDREVWTFNDGGRAAAGFKGLTSDCVCRSIAIAAGLPYRDVYDEIIFRAEKERPYTRRNGKKPKGRSHPRTGVFRPTYEALLRDLGFEWTPTMRIGTGCKVHLRKEELPSEGPLVVSVTHHLTCVVDGVIQDTHDPSRNGTRCVYGYYQKVRPEWTP